MRNFILRYPMEIVFGFIFMVLSGFFIVEQVKERRIEQAYINDVINSKHGWKNFEIVYFGTKQCPPCESWVASEYEDWKRSNLSKSVKLHVYHKDSFRELRSGGFSRHNWLFDKIMSETTGGFGTPYFALLHDGKLLKHKAQGYRDYVALIEKSRKK